MNDAIFSTADPFFGTAIPKRMVLQIYYSPSAYEEYIAFY